MPALRIMTFNVQCLPLAAMALQAQSNDADERAERIVDALLDLPADDQPDVIALNEVFDEDAREVFLKRLKLDWPHIVGKVHDGGVKEDSGLMLFSRLPFLM